MTYCIEMSTDSQCLAYDIVEQSAHLLETLVYGLRVLWDSPLSLVGRHVGHFSQRHMLLRRATNSLPTGAAPVLML